MRNKYIFATVAMILSVFFATAFMFGCEDQKTPVQNTVADNSFDPTTNTNVQMTGTYPPPPEFEGCETAFGWYCEGSTCFRELDLNNDGRNDFNRWGWTVGPLTEGTYKLDLYAGAGQCDLDKGTLVGYADVVYSGGTVTVTYTLLDGYTLNDVHVYLGADEVPTLPNGKYTVAPGQYTQGDEAGGATTYTFTFNNVSGAIYVIVHAEVCAEPYIS